MTSALRLLFVIILFAVLRCGYDSSAQEMLTTATQGKKMEESPPFRIINPESMAKPTAGYSQVAQVNDGKIIYTAGQVALDKSGNLVGKDDLRAQVQQVFENLSTAVQATGGDFKRVIKLNYYCVGSVDTSPLPVVREIRDKYVDIVNPPTSTFVFVQRLVRPEWLNEVDAVAVVKK